MRSVARTLTAVVAAGVLLIPGVLPAQAAPADPNRFTPAPAGLEVTGTPLGLSDKPETLVVQLSGDPITVTESESASPLTVTQKDTQRTRLRAAQAPVASRIKAAGGTVVATYQNAYNGIKVRMSPRKAAALSDVPGVVAVHRMTPVSLDNTHGVPLIGAPDVWDGLNGFHGENVKVAIIDTGIDYTHADFGGPGTAAAYETAHATETKPADPAWFGRKAPKVKGGIDLVGDSYNADTSSADYQPVPHPDPNPLDCQGHGSHVAGTAAGFGVTSDGKTYAGPYNDATVSSHSWNVGPGVAPKADLYAIRVFGCAGSTDVVVDAIEWAVDHDMDVINMSLGSDFGTADSPDAVAADNAAKAGVIVVASSGNEGSNPYMTGSPASGSRVISVAASDPTSTFPAATLTLSTGATLDAIVANGAAVPSGPLPVKVLRTAAGGIALGCSVADYQAADVTGAIAVVARGTCARVARAIYGQQAGAAAVLMVNNADSFPPYEGQITSNPDTGEAYTVTIPFLGVPSSDGAALLAADGGTATLAATTLDNPDYLAPASFTSAGPRSGDSALKPNVTAPGVSISSVAIGSGTGSEILSGTSMAAPHTAGMAALVVQAHPKWNKVKYLKAAIENTADPAQVAGYSTRVAGTGLIQAVGATQTSVVALAGDSTAALSYGFAELGKDYRRTQQITLHNFGTSAVTFTVGTAEKAGSPHSVILGRNTVRVAAKGTASVNVTLAVPAATAGDSTAFNDVAGLITLTPSGSQNHGVALRVPYYLVPQATSSISTSLNTTKLVKAGAAVATVTNRRGVVTGAADWYAWGLSDKKESKNKSSANISAVGIQSFPSDGALAIAISTENRWSNAAENEFDVYLDVNGDGTDDYAVVGADLGALTTGTFSGELAVFVFDLATGGGSVEFLADAPYNSSTLVLPVLFDQLCTTPAACLSSSNPRFTYQAIGFSQTDGSSDAVTGTAAFNAFTPALSTGMYNDVAPNASVNVNVSINKTEFALTPAKGFMVISHDNPSSSEAQLIPVAVK